MKMGFGVRYALLQGLLCVCPLIVCQKELFAQADTIFTPTEIIPCQVLEVGMDVVRFSYPGSEVPIALNKTAIVHVALRTGQRLKFAQALAVRTVAGGEDFERVSFTTNAPEVAGLFKLGLVSSLAKGTTPLASVDKVRERAYRKLQTRAAMLGANVLFLTSTTTSGNHQGISSAFQPWKPTMTLLTAVAYSNTIPSFQGFMQRMGEKRRFRTQTLYRIRPNSVGLTSRTRITDFVVYDVINEDGLIILKGMVPHMAQGRFRVISYGEKWFMLELRKHRTLYNLRVDF